MVSWTIGELEVEHPVAKIARLHEGVPVHYAGRSESESHENVDHFTPRR